MPSSTMRVPMAATHAQRLPEYNGPGQAPAVAQTSARLDDSAGAIATANWRNGTAGDWKYIAQTADNLMKATDSAFTIYDKYSKYKAQDALNQYQEEMMVKKADLERLQGSNAIGANGGKGIREQLQEYSQEARARLGKDLNERSRMFFDRFASSEDKKNYVWAVGREQKEWNAYQKTVDMGTIATATTAAEADSAQIGNSMGVIKATVEQMGRREGWSPEYTQSMLHQEEQKLVANVFNQKVASRDIGGAKQFLAGFASKMTPEARIKAQDSLESLLFTEAMNAYNQGDEEGMMKILSGSTDYQTNGNVYQGMTGRVGSLSAKFESGSEGMLAIGYDEKGGTSYGTVQLSSKQGSWDEYLKMLTASGPEGAAIAERLTRAGTANTGSREGSVPDQWRREVGAHGKLMSDVMHQYISKTVYEPSLKKLDPELRKLVEGDGVLQDVLWSTAVQHFHNTPGIWNKVYKSGMTKADLVRAIYDERGTRFPGSNERVRAAVLNRFKEEKSMALGALGAGPQRRTNTATVAWGEERKPEYLATPNKPVEMLEQGTIDIANRPMVKNPDGSISTVRSMSITETVDGKDVVVLLPTIGPNGENWDDKTNEGRDAAINHYRKTGQHLGVFKTQDAADIYAEDLHKQQERLYPNSDAKFADGAAPGDAQIDPTTGLPISKPKDRTKNIPKFTFSNPVLNYRASQMFEAAQKKQSERRVQGIVDDVFKKTAGMKMAPPQKGDGKKAGQNSSDERTQIAIQMIAQQTQDPEERTKALQLWSQQTQFDDMAQKARTFELAANEVNQARKEGLSPTDFLAKLSKNHDISDEVRTLAGDLYHGKVEKNYANMEATDNLFREIDKDPRAWDNRRIREYAYNNRMTIEQAEAGQKYLADGGKFKGVSIGQVESIWKRYSGNPNGKMPAEFYDKVMGQVEGGKPPSDDELRQIVRREFWAGTTPGTGWFGGEGSETYGDARAQGRESQWKPTIKSDVRDQVRLEIARQTGVHPDKVKDVWIDDYVRTQILGLSLAQN